MGLMTQKDMAQQEDGDVGTIRPWKKSMRETVEDAVGGFFGGDYWANKTAKNLTGLADFVPVVGDAAGAMDTVDSIDRGDYLGASIDGFATLLGVTPVVGPAVSKGVKSLKKPLKDALGAKPNSMGTKPDRNVANVESEKVLDKAKVGVENHSRILEDHGLREWDGVGSRADTFSFKNDKLEVYTGYSQEVDGKITRGYDTNVLSPNTTVKSIKRILGYDVGPAPKIAFERGDIGVNQALMGGDFLKKYGKDVISRMDTLASKATVYAQKDKLLSPIKDGTKVGVRLNLNSKVPDSPQGLDKLQTLHKNNFNGEVLSFQPYATVENAVFSVKPEGRQSISAKILGVDVPEAKGKYNAMSVDGNLAPSKNVVIKGGRGVREIGFNPKMHHLFVDMETGQAVKGADVATVIGDRVYARGVKYWKKSEAPEVMDASDGTPLPSEVRYKFNKGGLVDAEMATLNFSHGGSVHGKVGASNVGADMLAKLIAQNKQGDFKRGDAREVMQEPKSTPTTVDDRPALDAAVIKMVQDHKRTQVERAEEFSTPQGITDKLSNLAEVGGELLSNVGESVMEAGEEAFDFGENVARKVYRKGRGVIKGAYNNLTSEVDEEMKILQADNTPTKISQEAVPPISTDHRGKAALKRGVRNNNPLNIEKEGANVWDGIASDQDGDDRFATFESAEYGIRAALRTLVTYQDKHKLKTPTEMIYRWAPPWKKDKITGEFLLDKDGNKIQENDTPKYIADVKDMLKTNYNIDIDMTSPMVIGNNQQTLDLIKGMIAKENSQNAMRGYSSDTYNRALQLAFPPPKIRDDEPLPKERKLDLTKWNEIIP